MTRPARRTAFAVLALADTALAAAPPRWRRVRRARRVTKPLLVPTLAVGPGQGPPGLAPAQALSWCGDVALMRPGRAPFLAGLGCFLAAHVAYVSAFRARSSAPLLGTPRRRALLVGGAAFASAMGVAAGRADRALALPVAAYGATLAAMVTAAAAVDDERGRDRLLAGAVLFLVSDSLIGVREFLLGEARGAQALDGAVMATYTAAQWCIAEGLARG